MKVAGIRTVTAGLVIRMGKKTRGISKSQSIKVSTAVCYRL